MANTYKTTEDIAADREAARNEDPFTGEAGAHPIGVGLGTALGATATGMALGASAGPVGAVAGAVAGGLMGALAGKGVAEVIDPTEEDAYWSENYASRPYTDHGTSYSTYSSAYKYGVHANNRYPDHAFEDVESELGKGWETARGNSTLPWDRARPATKDAYERARTLRRERTRENV